MQCLLVDLRFVPLEDITVWRWRWEKRQSTEMKVKVESKINIESNVYLNWHKFVVQCLKVLCSLLRRTDFDRTGILHLSKTLIFQHKNQVKKAFNNIFPCWSSTMKIVLTTELIKLFMLSSAIFRCFANYRCTFRPRLPLPVPTPHSPFQVLLTFQIILEYFLLSHDWLETHSLRSTIGHIFG